MWEFGYDKYIKKKYCAKLIYKIIITKKIHTFKILQLKEDKIKKLLKYLSILKKKWQMNKNDNWRKENTLKSILNYNQSVWEIMKNINQKIKVHKINFEKYKETNEIKKINYIFELNRNWFHRKINKEKNYKIEKVYTERITELLKKNWEHDINWNCIECPEICNETKSLNKIFIKFQEFKNSIKTHIPWKRQKPDKIYNFWLQKIYTVN